MAQTRVPVPHYSSSWPILGAFVALAAFALTFVGVRLSVEYFGALDTIGYAAGLWVIATYSILVKQGDPLPMHWANAIGGIAVLTTSVLAHGWAPVLTLTVLFTIAGWVGIIHSRSKAC